MVYTDHEIRTEQNFIDVKLRPHTGGVIAQRSTQTVIYRHAELNNTRNNTSNVMNTYITLKILGCKFIHDYSSKFGKPLQGTNII